MSRSRRQQRTPVCYLRYKSTLAGGRLNKPIVQKVLDTVWLKPHDIVVTVSGRSFPVVFYHLDRVNGRVYQFNQSAKEHTPRGKDKRHVGNFGEFVTP